MHKNVLWPCFPVCSLQNSTHPHSSAATAKHTSCQAPTIFEIVRILPQFSATYLPRACQEIFGPATFLDCTPGVFQVVRPSRSNVLINLVLLCCSSVPNVSRFHGDFLDEPINPLQCVHRLRLAAPPATRWCSMAVGSAVVGVSRSRWTLSMILGNHDLSWGCSGILFTWGGYHPNCGPHSPESRVPSPESRILL